MKNTIMKILLIIIFSIFLISGSLAQNKLLRKAKRHEFRGEYIKALTSYQLYLNNNESDILIYKKLAEISYKIGDYNSAEMYCEEIINKNLTDPETYFIYIHVLRRNSKYEKSKAKFNEFKIQFPNEIYKYFRSNIYPLKNKFYTNGQKVKIFDFDFNSVNSEFSPFILNQDIFYTCYDNGNYRDMPDTKVEKFINQYINPFKPNYKIFKAKADTFSMTYKKIELNKLFNSKYHEGIVSVSSSGEIMYLSAASKSEKPTFNHAISGFDIYEARLIDNKWKLTQKIFNIPGKSFAHPCINRQCNMLYFASDIDGGYGGIDLYVSYLTNGKWSKPENLGPQINTPGNELYPYIDSNNILYFASDGHWGLGGLDIFVISVDNGKLNIHNAGIPINSRFDDYGISCFSDNTSGLFSSNRPGGAGEQDIYKFKTSAPLNEICKSSNNNSLLGFMTLKGEVIDTYTNLPINNAKLSIRDNLSNNSSYNTSTINGKFTFIVPIEGEYSIEFSAIGYDSLTTNVVTGKNFLTINVKPKFTFPNINFDYNSSLITEKGKETLNKIIDCLFKYPHSKISIKGYADIISEEKDNKRISHERVLSIKKYLENKGISKNRITSESLGTKNPIITLNDKVAFEKEDAQSANRRVEINITHPPLNSTKN